MVSGVDSFALLAIPFFVFAGQIMNKGGIAKRLIDFARAMVGPFRGGLAFVNIIACMLFGSISGSATAAASAIGGFMGPSMEKEGYGKDFSAAVNVTSATTGLLIPPSNILIVYSLVSGGVSIAALFMAGYIPGILTGTFLMIVAGIWARKKNYPKGKFLGYRNILITLFRAIPSLMLLVIVIGGIIAGYFTATEASAIAVIYALGLSFYYREVKVKDLPQIILDSVKTTAIVMLLVAISIGMGWVISFENIPQTMSEALLSLSDNKLVILLMINLILLFVGIFMDMTPAVLIFTPIFLPIAIELGFHPVHFGIMMVANLCIGLCTPPVGTILFVGCSIAETKIQKIIRPLIPLYIAMIVSLVLISIFPDLVMLLPELLGY
jgi:tripartite ATP-independent transporter DctM subunit